MRDAAGHATPLTIPVVVAPEAAAPSYTGATSATGNPVTVGLAAAVAEVADGSPGDLGTATVSFREGTRALCGPVPVATGRAACTAALVPGAHAVTVVVGGRYAGSATGRVAVSAPAVVNPLVCGTSIALTDVSRHGKRVRIAGVAEAGLAGRRLRLTAGAKTVGHATVRADGGFAARVRAPKGARAGRTRYRARSGTRRSAAVPLTRALTATVTGTRASGRLTGRRHARRRLRIERTTGCPAITTRSATVRTDRRGRFTVRLRRPAAGTIAVYRVRTASGSPRAVSLPLVVAGR